ncbi:MAG: Cytidine deaminase [Cytophagales bacterium]|nr:cytidine deaminase [Bacteroidota bacterium]MBS1982029.1 cytidine deaminase [Bacteroidota bacterium]WHZ09486.1 MAG: Cytidine deaminase [Cytophagales bacterium]
MTTPITFFNHLEDLDTESKYLVHKAKEATALAYAPYSKFCVGAALILEDGSVITGANQENASYPLCMCAERVALYAATATHPNQTILKIAVVAHKKNHKDLTPATCCGACRQVILEFEQRQKKPIEIIMFGTQNQWLKTTATALMPLGFGKESLE